MVYVDHGGCLAYHPPSILTIAQLTTGLPWASTRVLWTYNSQTNQPWTIACACVELYCRSRSSSVKLCKSTFGLHITPTVTLQPPQETFYHQRYIFNPFRQAEIIHLPWPSTLFHPCWRNGKNSGHNSIILEDCVALSIRLVSPILFTAASDANTQRQQHSSHKTTHRIKQ